MDFIYKITAYITIVCFIGLVMVFYDYFTHDKKKKK